MSNELYVYVDLDKLNEYPDHPVVAARKIIDAAFLRGVPNEDDRCLYTDKGKECGYFGSANRDLAETANEASYRKEREKNAFLRAEVKGLREALKEAEKPADEKVEALIKKIEDAEYYARQSVATLSA
jgi:hypothetical protein